MRTITRFAAVWLSAAAFGGCAAFVRLQTQLAPDFYVAEWQIHTLLLFVVAVGAGVMAMRPWRSISRAALALAVGHVVAAIGTHEFLNSRITCVNSSQNIDYWLPADTGALLLYAPMFAVVVVVVTAANMRRPAARPL